MIHKHIWIQREKPMHDNINIHDCLVCGKVKSFKETNFKNKANYLWCPTCGFELTGRSIEIKEFYEKDLKFYEYKCTRCGRKSSFTYDLAPCPISIESVSVH